MQEDEILFTEFFNQRLKQQGLTLKDLADATGIAIKHLESFSHGRFERLPSAPYVHGYFIKLAPILDFDPDEWWNRIKTEEAVHRSGSADRMPKNRFSRWPGKAFLAGLVAVILVGIYFTARFTTIIGEPNIIILSPAAQAENLSSDVINSTLSLSGRIWNGDSLLINGDNVPLDENGGWTAEISLQPGPNTIELRAGKFLGREKVLLRQVYYNNARVINPAPETDRILEIEPVPESEPATSTPESGEF